MANALILGADTATGAYLARLLDARGIPVSGVLAGDGAALTDLGIAAAVTPVAAADVARLVTESPALTVFAINDGSAAQADLVAEVLAAGAAAFQRPRLSHVVDSAALRQSPALLDQAKKIVAWRKDDGLFATNAILHAHDSRLGPADSMPARVTAAAWRAAQAKGEMPTTPVEFTETGPADWGWTPEYVDAIIRLAAMESPQDLAIGSGTLLSIEDFVRDAFAYFKLDPTGHVRVLPAADAPQSGPAVDTARLKAATGWSASTHGRDLVRALAEGAASRA
jgi:GDP-D-mannose dehydratase